MKPVHNDNCPCCRDARKACGAADRAIERADTADARVAELEKDVDLLSRWIVDHEKYVTGARDHACPECVPDGPLVSKTFVCARHRAKALQKTLADADAAADSASETQTPQPAGAGTTAVQPGVPFAGLERP